MSKRRTPGSGLRGAELFKAIYILEDLQRLSTDEEMEEGMQGGAAKVVSEKITDLLAILRTKTEGPLSFSFPHIDFDILDTRLDISPGKLLVKNGKHADRVAESIAQGDGNYMTSQDMYRHLKMLDNLVPHNNEAGARLWIDTIFFRVSAMLSAKRSMVLNVEQYIPPVEISTPDQNRSVQISGTIDYAALTTEPSQHESFLRSSRFQFVKRLNPNGLFVTEAKQEGVELADHIPRAVAEMYAAAKHLTKEIIRGALTNGHEWIFLILYLSKDRPGGTYMASPTIKMQVSNSYPYEVLAPGPDIVAGILAYWMERSFIDLDENDWFSSPRPRAESAQS